MTKSLPTTLILCAIAPQHIYGLRSSRASARRHLQSTKHCGTDALSAFFSCAANTLCSESSDCNEGENCFEIDCPISTPIQTEEDIVDEIDNAMSIFNLNNTLAKNETLTNETMGINVTTATLSTSNSSFETTNATTTSTMDVATSSETIDPISIVAVNSSTAEEENMAEPVSTVSANSSSGDVKDTTPPSISIAPSRLPTRLPTTANPTITPSVTYENWTNFDYKESTKFCGPKVVGGYDIAVAQCGPLTTCGTTITSNQYGSSGNDCPKNYMCYSDITCENGPGPDTTTTSTTEFLTTSTEVTTEWTEAPDETKVETTTTSSEMITTVAETSTTTTSTKAITTTTVPPTYPVHFTTRAAFCGSFYAEAVLNCGTKTICTSSSECQDEEECFENVSCTYDPNAEVDTADERLDQYSSEGINSDTKVSDDQDESNNSQDLIGTTTAEDDVFSLTQDEDENGSNISKGTQVYYSTFLLSFFFVIVTIQIV